jgi:hypothetical protein
MRVWGAYLFIIIILTPLNIVKAQVADVATAPQNNEDANKSTFPLEIVIRPRVIPLGDGFYENRLLQTIYGQKLKLTGYHLTDTHRRIVDGKVIYDVWQNQRNLLTHNVLKEAGLMSLPSFEDRLANELLYGSDIGWRIGGIYKDLSLLEVGYSFSFDAAPPRDGFATSGLWGQALFNTDYSHDQMTLGVIDFSSVEKSP